LFRIRTYDEGWPGGLFGGSGLGLVVAVGCGGGAGGGIVIGGVVVGGVVIGGVVIGGTEVEGAGSGTGNDAESLAALRGCSVVALAVAGSVVALAVGGRVPPGVVTA
jgi:hypothetical protein